MEEEAFMKIRSELVAALHNVKEGQMMRSPAIIVNDEVFAFFSRKKKMVFKLRDSYIPTEETIRPFNPFKNKGPLRGWYEVDFDLAGRWKEFSHQALQVVSHDK